MRALLIAERGVVAVRIARACADLGVRSIAVHADDDAGSLHVAAADEAFALPSVPGDLDGYRDMQALLDVAERSGADAVHPGCGPLSENAEFARRVVAAGLTWVGPDPETMELLGDKVSARALAEEVGAPLVVGTSRAIRRADEAVAFAQRHGLPVALKAAHGGGGQGLRVARRLDEVADLLDSAVRESASVFGRGEVFVEQYLDRPRHVEAQVLGDGEGGVVVVGTRDCSTQRRHQKLVAEAPAPFLDDEQLAVVTDVSVALCSSVRYRGAGTVEFLVSQAGVVSFLEVGTALSVEHALTEQVAGVDLVRQQLLVAQGLPTEVLETPTPVGHAVSFRVTAEDAGRGFLPALAPVASLRLPGGPGVRVDEGCATGDELPPGRDPLLLTLVVQGRDRDEALRRARRALHDLVLEGPVTTVPFHRHLLDEPAFAAPGDEPYALHTRWIEQECHWLEALAHRTPEARVGPATLRTVVEVAGRRVPLGLPAALADTDVVAALVAAVVETDGGRTAP
ncbi:acetyl-CoA/propionyl-CoA carboxylase biotin carboxyl carrier protein [Frigoribacterium sp. PhB160]|uniref:acetyl-CoA carboxylase biotin carboxylase subunit n=1 Tax=Frigoribacterium sp. PhB160 TaxID=2485192 RepID=UPI000FB53B7E|nr:biotin carboxylase N-terminal domain-containing protein [Frigoribacterium sp. PhB160]ROS62530.1 acetyl-CoA/propionyl-CoA carboxylase biotin carboxyl carrier protein [Frigoribacterium sp. PhB160]